MNDLGTFSLHYEPARIEGEKLLPPRNVVTLDTKTDDDNLGFTNFICREKQCLLTEANREITQWVEELKNALANNKSISFEEFGTFSQDSKGRLTFEALDIPDLNIEFEGMPELSLNVSDISTEEPDDNEPQTEDVKIEEPISVKEPISTEEPDDNEPQTEDVKTEEPVSIKEPIITEEPDDNEPQTEDVKIEEPISVKGPISTEEPDDATPQEEETETEDSEVEDTDNTEETETPKKRRSLWWLFTLILLLILATLGYIFRNKIQDIIRPVFERFTHKEVEATKPEEIDSDTVSFTEEDTTAVTDTAVVEEPYEPEIIKSSSAGYPYIRFEQGHYYVIAGSFPSEKDVLAHIRAKHLDEYSPKLVLQDGAPNIRICIGIYDTEEEAETFAKSINPKYWVLK